jgi:hypothetical protein
MDMLIDLWLPIVLSAVFVFIASALMWMMMPHHKGDWTKAPNEDALLHAIRSPAMAPGQYMIPYCAGNQGKDQAFQQKWKAGPTGVLTVTNACSMGRNMALSFIFYLVTSVFVAYLATLSLPAGAEYLKVFQVTGTAAILAYCFASIPHAIWFGRPLRATINDLFDGVVYGLLTAGTFGWLWDNCLGAPGLIPALG